jgi:V/A-type H+-transporting ATPase subunit I
MFGLMFGDVGQGAAVAAAGWWIWRRMARHRDYAVILMECGLSSIVFGFAFGSFFGREDLIPALWFRPMEDVPRLLRFGAGFGLSFLSLAFALGVVNAVLRREWLRGVFSPQGLFAAATYWIAAALGLRWLATGEWGLGTGRVALLCGAPLALFWARVLWAELHEHGSPLLDAVLRSAVEVVDFVVRSIANTVSFVRLAAFAVSHAGLLVAVFALADAVGSSPAGNVLGVVVIVVGNLAIVALEGLIVSIQAVRLVYYEFFSKFYEGMGLEFRPLRLAPRGATEGRT